MQSKDILVAGWEETYDKEGWYPPLRAALNGVDYQHSLWQAPGKAAHTIAELVEHLLYYKKRFLYRLERKSWPYAINTNDESFLSTFDRSPGRWKKTVDELAMVHKQIQEKMIDLTDTDLDLKLPDTAVGGQILTLIMHDAYHTGQIIFIRKLYGSWPAIRET